MDEVDKGLLAGPFGVSELSDSLGPSWVGARRFGIKQGQKVRAIDDFSEFLVNATFGSHEKVKINSLDHVIQTARAFIEAVSGDALMAKSTSGKMVSSDINQEWG
eukprot:9971184-Karenia_brevis.AAC.1